MVVLYGTGRLPARMARMTFFTSFFVSVFEASKTLKLMIVTHFQLFFLCPGASKKEPKGPPTFAFFVSFFVLGPNGVQGEPRKCPREPQRGSGGAPEAPKAAQKESRGSPRGAQGRPKSAQESPGEPKKVPRVPKKRSGESRERTVAGRPQASGYIYIYIYIYIRRTSFRGSRAC